MNNKILTIDEATELKRILTNLVYATNDDNIINTYFKDKVKFKEDFTHYFYYDTSTITKEVADLIVFIFRNDIEYINAIAK